MDNGKDYTTENGKNYTINFKAMPEDISVFEPLEAEPAEELFDYEVSYEELVFDSGLTEAVRRLLKNHNDYDMVKYVRTILDAEYEGEKKVE